LTQIKRVNMPPPRHVDFKSSHMIQ
jgi:hypothetical protein